MKGRHQHDWHYDLDVWSRSTLGRCFLAQESDVMRARLATLFGRHLLHLGVLPRTPMLDESRILHRIQMMPTHRNKHKPDCIVSDMHDLPFQHDSLDVVIVQHALEFVEHPHEILREAHRVLVPEGHLIICGFNPFSTWGLWRVIGHWFNMAPWRGHFYSIERIKDWIKLLGFGDIELTKYFYRPPLPQKHALDKLRFLENLAKVPWLPGGAGYMMVAQKRVIKMMLVRRPTRIRQRIAAPSWAQPTMRR